MIMPFMFLYSLLSRSSQIWSLLAVHSFESFIRTDTSVYILGKQSFF